jgi:hypothetical protein
MMDRVGFIVRGTGERTAVVLVVGRGIGQVIVFWTVKRAWTGVIV